MSISLQVTSGPSNGMRIHIVRGQIVKVGRTDWADYSFPSDSSMADVHFAVHGEGAEYQIRDISSGAGTLVNGAPVKEAVLHTGDAVVAGRTVFSVVVDGESAPVRYVAPAKAAADENAKTVVTTSPTPIEAAEICRELKMGDQAREFLHGGMAPVDYLNLLIERELYTDALRFLAFWLPKSVAVGWACDCVAQIFGEVLGQEDQNALAAARQWARDPSEANRRLAEAAANTTGFNGAASWLALSAFWSGGSLAGPELPVVPPGAALTAEAITGAFMLAATHNEPLKAASRYQEFLTRGQLLISKTIHTTGT